MFSQLNLLIELHYSIRINMSDNIYLKILTNCSTKIGRRMWNPPGVLLYNLLPEEHSVAVKTIYIIVPKRY